MRYCKIYLLCLSCLLLLSSCAFQPKLPKLPKLSELPDPTWLAIDARKAFGCRGFKNNVLLRDPRIIANPSNLFDVTNKDLLDLFSRTLIKHQVPFSSYDGNSYITRKQRLLFDTILMIKGITLFNRYASDGTLLDAYVDIGLYRPNGQEINITGSGTILSKLLMKDIIYAPNMEHYERLGRAFDNLFKQKAFMTEICTDIDFQKSHATM